ncbi:MAG: NAD(P)H-quinone oxidoreductase subunit 4 [Cyanophyceae cyanobacterium]
MNFDPATFPWLSTVILYPVIAALFIPLIPAPEGDPSTREHAQKLAERIRWFALVIGISDLLILVAGFYLNYDISTAELQMVEQYDWVPQVGLRWSVGADGLSMPLILLTGFITTLAILASWPVTWKPRLFYFLILAMYGGQIGVFAVQDMLLFFFMWELELLPVYLLLSIWGGKNRLYAATKFILYTALSSLFILVAALGMAFFGDTVTFDMRELAAKAYPVGLQLLFYGAFFIAYAVKLPIFPLHTWLPDAHGEATAPVHMLLAGILLKMGGYALLRMNVGMLPDAHLVFAPVLVVLGIVNIIFAALTSFGQRNLKRKIAYSSISHMGFVLIGIGCLTELGMSGAMLQMISHGLIGASLFFLVGATYDRTHTLVLEEMGGIGLKMPKIFSMFTVCSLASLALPGMSGFVAEIMVFLGLATTDAFTGPFKVMMVFLAAVGVILTPIYLLSMLRQIFFGPENTELTSHEELVDAEPREVFVIACLLIPIIGIGIYPRLTTQIYDRSTDKLVATLRGYSVSQTQTAALAKAEVAENLLPTEVLTAPALR